MTKFLPLLIIILLGSGSPGFASTEKDSLFALYKKSSKEDSSRLNLLTEICQNMLAESSYSLRYYARELISESKKQNAPYYLVRGQNYLGISYSIEGNDLHKALSLYQAAYKACREHQGEKWLTLESSTLNNIASVHFYLKEIELAKKYNLQAVEVAYKTHSNKVIGAALRGAAMIHMTLGEFDEAYTNALGALGRYKSAHDFKGEFNSRILAYQIKMAEHEYREALRYLISADEMADSLYNSRDYVTLPLNFGKYYMEMRNYDRAEQEFLHALSISPPEEHLLLDEIYGHLVDLYRSTGDFRTALDMQEKRMELFQKRFKKEKLGQVAELETFFQTEEIRTRNKLLEKNNAGARQFSRLMAIIVLLAFLVIGLTILVSRRVKEKNRQIETQRSDLSQVNNRMQLMREQRQLFVSLLAHEVKSDLLTMSIHLKRLENRVLSERDGTLEIIFDRMKISLQSTYAIIGNIIQAERLEDDNEFQAMSSIDVAHILQELIHGEQSRVKDFVLSLDYKTDGSRPHIIANAKLFRFLVSNLLTNAVKSSPPGGRITVQMETKGQNVRILVEDQGPGISSLHRDKIFDKYYSTDNSPGGYTANGFGLYFVKHYVSALNGSIVFDEDFKEGCLAIITIPVSEQGVNA